jgi:hypothetical protein
MSLSEGRKRLIEAFDEISQKRSRSALEEPRGPLHGVVICLTGLTSENKIHLHTLVEKLGGRYVLSMLVYTTFCKGEYQCSYSMSNIISK